MVRVNQIRQKHVFWMVSQVSSFCALRLPLLLLGWLLVFILSSSVTACVAYTKTKSLPVVRSALFHSVIPGGDRGSSKDHKHYN